VWKVDELWREVTDQVYDVISGCSDSADVIRWGISEVLAMLLYKNKMYGDSALSPISVIAPPLPASTLIKIRIDDKLQRWKMGNGKETEDLVLDLIGYFVLLRIAMKREEAAENVTNG
jgi:hypothetical protein